MIFDAHCHAWRCWPYDTAVPDAGSRGSADALLFEMDAHGVERAAIVAARIGAGAGGAGYGNEDNNRYVARFASTHADRITAWVDVDCVWRTEYHAAGAAARLLAEVERSGVSGFTHYFGDEDDGWLRSDAGREFFRTAAEAGLIASLAVSAPWYGDLRVVAEENPSLPVLIHHLGHPRSQEDVDELVGLADVPSIGVKVSGFNYAAEHPWDYPYLAVQDRYRRIASEFGPHRLYWGSDFPASRDHLTYSQALAVVCDHSTFLARSELAAVLGENLAHLIAHPRLAPDRPLRDHQEETVR